MFPLMSNNPRLGSAVTAVAAGGAPPDYDKGVLPQAAPNPRGEGTLLEQAVPR